jgi:predicted PurR-regulated permease PerM
MMRIDWRRTLVIELTILAGCALAVVAWLVLARVLHTALLLLMASVVAFAVEPLVAWVEARLGRRRPAAVVVYLGLAVAMLGGLALLASPFVQQASGLLEDLPRLADAAKEQAPAIDVRMHALGLPLGVQDVQTRAVALLVDSGSVVLGGSVALLGGLANVVVDLLLVLVMSLYLVLGGARLRTTFLRLVPLDRRQQARFVEETVVRVAGGYLRGQLVMALSIGVLAWLGAMLFGLRYPVVVGVVAGVLELVPMVGPMLAAGFAVRLLAEDGRQLVPAAVHRPTGRPWRRCAGLGTSPGGGGRGRGRGAERTPPRPLLTTRSSEADVQARSRPEAVVGPSSCDPASLPRRCRRLPPAALFPFARRTRPSARSPSRPTTRARPSCGAPSGRDRCPGRTRPRGSGCSRAASSFRPAPPAARRGTTRRPRTVARTAGCGSGPPRRPPPPRSSRSPAARTRPPR